MRGYQDKERARVFLKPHLSIKNCTNHPLPGVMTSGLTSFSGIAHNLLTALSWDRTLISGVNIIIIIVHTNYCIFLSKTHSSLFVGRYCA